jgi:hypothetical protein
MSRKFWRKERFLNASVKVRKATIRSVMSVYPSVRMEHIGSHGRNSHEIWNLTIFQKSVQKIHASLKSDQNRGYFTWRPIYTLTISLSFFLEWEMLQKKSKHTFYVVPFFFFVSPSQKRAVSEIMWEHSRVGGGHKWQHGARAFHPGYLSYKHPLSENVILNCHLLHQRLHERASYVTLYVHCLSCLTYRYIIQNTGLHNV